MGGSGAGVGAIPGTDRVPCLESRGWLVRCEDRRWRSNREREQREQVNPFKKQYDEDMAPPSDVDRRRTDRFKGFLLLLSVAGAASFGGYMLAQQERRAIKPVATAVIPIEQDLVGSTEPTTDGVGYLLLRQARNGDGDAQYEVAQWYLQNRPEEPTGMRWMMASARNGHPGAVGWMAYLYAEGDNRPVDRIRSAAWAMIAAEIGAPLPDRRKVMAYLTGLTEGDRKKAETVADTFRVEVRSNYQRRQATGKG